MNANIPSLNLSSNPVWLIIYAGEREDAQYSMGLVCPKCAAKVAKSFIDLKAQGIHPFVTFMVDQDIARESNCAYCGAERQPDAKWAELAAKVKAASAKIEEARKAGQGKNKALMMELFDTAVAAEKARNQYWMDFPAKEFEINPIF